MWWTDNWPVPFMFFGPLMMIVFVVVCATVMFFFMRVGMGHRGRSGYALEVLKERLARGEINEAEYEARRRLLEA